MSLTDMGFNPTDQELSKEQELALANQRIVGSVPQMEPPSDPVFTLPRGIHTGSGWATSVEVRELTGSDEEALVKYKNPADSFDAILCLGTVRVGDTDLTRMTMGERSVFLGNLLLGEREQVFMEIVKVTFGDNKTISFDCPSCGAQSVIDLILSEDLKINTMANPQQTTFSFTTYRDDVVIEYRLPVGADQKEVFSQKGITEAEQNTIFMSRCILKVNQRVPVDSLEFVRSMSIRDRRTLVKLIVDQQPSVKTTIDLTCPSCAEVQPVTLSWEFLFQT